MKKKNKGYRPFFELLKAAKNDCYKAGLSESQIDRILAAAPVALKLAVLRGIAYKVQKKEWTAEELITTVEQLHEGTAVCSFYLYLKKEKLSIDTLEKVLEAPGWMAIQRLLGEKLAVLTQVSIIKKAVRHYLQNNGQ